MTVILKSYLEPSGVNFLICSVLKQIERSTCEMSLEMGQNVQYQTCTSPDQISTLTECIIALACTNCCLILVDSAVVEPPEKNRLCNSRTSSDVMVLVRSK